LRARPTRRRVGAPSRAFGALGLQQADASGLIVGGSRRERLGENPAPCGKSSGQHGRWPGRRRPLDRSRHFARIVVCRTQAGPPPWHFDNGQGKNSVDALGRDRAVPISGRVRRAPLHKYSKVFSDDRVRALMSENHPIMFIWNCLLPCGSPLFMMAGRICDPCARHAASEKRKIKADEKKRESGVYSAGRAQGSGVQPGDLIQARKCPITNTAVGPGTAGIEHGFPKRGSAGACPPRFRSHAQQLIGDILTRDHRRGRPCCEAIPFRGP